MKFLILWELDTGHIGLEAVQAVLRMPEYGKRLKDQGKLAGKFHVVGKHGGAWLYEVTSNEELERLLAMAPVYNFARYQVYPLAEMENPAEILQPAASKAES